jgi:hypothetical protein
VPVTVRRGLTSYIRRQRHGFVLVVHVADPSGVAAEAVAAARRDIAALDDGRRASLGLTPGMDTNTPAYVSDVMPLPNGYLLYVDGGNVSDRLLVTAPDVIDHHLQAAGIEAVIYRPKPTGIWEQIHQYTTTRLHSVVLSLVPHLPPTQFETPWSLPATWAEAAAAWLDEEPEGTPQSWLFVISTDIAVTPAVAQEATREFVTRAEQSRMAMTGNPQRSLRWVQMPANSTPILQLGASFTDSDVAGVEAAARELADLADQLAGDASYAWVDIAPGFDRGLSARGVGRPSEQPTPHDCGRALDRIVPDVYWHQVLGPLHLARTLANPSLQELPNGRASLTVGQLNEWLDWERGLPDNASWDAFQLPLPGPRVTVPAVLEPLLLSAEEARQLAWRLTQQSRPPADDPRTGAAAAEPK